MGERIEKRYKKAWDDTDELLSEKFGAIGFKETVVKKDLEHLSNIKVSALRNAVLDDEMVKLVVGTPRLSRIAKGIFHKIYNRIAYTEAEN